MKVSVDDGDCYNSFVVAVVGGGDGNGSSNSRSKTPKVIIIVAELEMMIADTGMIVGV